MFPEIKNYKILREIGAGGMAIVYEALDEKLGRRVAIKVLHPHLLQDSLAPERFINEARAAAKIDHPNVVRIYDFGTENNLFFMVMEYVPGINLEKILKERGKLTFEQTLTIMYEIGEALAEAHSINIVHRDVKPANILIHKQGRAMLSDFGLAKYLSDPNLTTEDVIVGTPMFMAPEQISKKAITPPTDIYSWGVCFYALLCGKLPYKIVDFPEILSCIRKGELCFDGEEFNFMPSTYQEIIHRCLLINPEERIKDGKELVTLLLEAEKEEKIRAPLAELLEEHQISVEANVDSASETSGTIVISKENNHRKINIFTKSIFYITIIVSILFMIFLVTNRKKRENIQPIVSDTLNSIKKVSINSITTQKHSLLTDESSSQMKVQLKSNNGWKKEQRITAIEESVRKVYYVNSTQHNISSEKPKNNNDSGSLFVSCFPWAYIYIDGKKVGVTPLAQPLTLESGKHTITLVNDFSDTVFDTVEIKSSTIVKKKYRLNLRNR